MDKVEILIPEFKPFAYPGTNKVWENHIVYRFPNGYGASIIQDENFSELMLVFFPTIETDYILFGKPTGDLTTEKIRSLLIEIKNNEKN